MSKLQLKTSIFTFSFRLSAVKSRPNNPRSLIRHGSAMPANFGDHEQKSYDPSAAEHRQDSEKAVGRNPHPDIAKVQASRPDWNYDRSWHFTKPVDPDWNLGCGANDGGESLKKEHVELDPYEDGRPAIFNYKLLM